MKNIMSVFLTISLLVLLVVGCSETSSTSDRDSEKGKSEKTTSETKDDSTKSKTDKPKKTLSSSKKPEGNAKTAKKDNTIPSDWIYVYDDIKGYGFYVPEGTTGESVTFDGIDVLEGSTPAPSELGFAVIAFKDREMSKNDLLDIAIKYLEGTGETITAEDLKAESEDYSVSNATTMMDGKKGKARILVGTDITDNYILVIGGDADRFDEYEKLIDEIWGSFEMWSGGSSGNN